MAKQPHAGCPTQLTIDMKTFSFLFVATSVLAACSQPAETQEPVAEVQHRNYMKPQYEETVLGQYLHMKDALVSSHVQSVRDAGKLMYMQLDIRQYEALVKPLTEIIETEDIEIQREAFARLSQAMQVAIENDDPLISKGREALFVQFCPMAFGNQGASWLSAEPNVLNPFYGDEMLTCGVVRDTL